MFDLGSAIVAGLIATVVMTLLMYAGKAMGMPMDMLRMGAGKVMQDPGLFGKNYGAMVPIGLLVLHIVYGITVG